MLSIGASELSFQFLNNSLLKSVLRLDCLNLHFRRIFFQAGKFYENCKFNFLNLKVDSTGRNLICSGKSKVHQLRYK